KQADGRWVKEFLRMKSPAGKEVYWLTGEFQNHHPVQDDSDTVALEAGYASLVPCKIDVTDYAYLNRFKQWEIEEQ
ncbi:MAG TPA: 5'/3'-nucleotidase SurE, partial [Macellibacteroides fermentans]|nr:5'/3'-nucleotidase SurE [Macellibacteroides fermentans]